MDERPRRVTRDPSRRAAEYTIADTASVWRRCYFTDVSLTGVGVDFIETPPPSAAVGSRIIIRLLNSAGEPNGVEFPGEIRHISAGQQTLRAGVEFADLDVTERAAIEMLLQRHFV
jgi:hypothetical protein